MEQDCKYYTLPVWANCDYYAKDLATNMREQDIEELNALGITDFVREITDSVRASDEAYVAYDAQGSVIVMYGIISSRGPGGQIWCLGSRRFNGFKKTFIHDCMKVLKQWEKRYKLLWNYIYQGNNKSIRWLGTYGAKFYRGFKINGNEFYRFEIGGEE